MCYVQGYSSDRAEVATFCIDFEYEEIDAVVDDKQIFFFEGTSYIEPLGRYDNDTGVHDGGHVSCIQLDRVVLVDNADDTIVIEDEALLKPFFDTYFDVITKHLDAPVEW